ncbi:MAG: WD40 repeat protein [Polyangiales bacterium]|jgi:WD40 repeat protein
MLRRMDWSKYAELSAEWTEKTLAYAGGINAFVARGIASGWDDAGEAPDDERDEALGDRVVEIVREANAEGAWRELRQHFPPAHAPFAEKLDARATPLRSVYFVGEGRVVATHGTAWQRGGVSVYGFDGQNEEVPGVLDVAASPDRRFFARLTAEHLVITDGWDGDDVAQVPRPRGDEGAPAGTETLAEDELACIEHMAVLPNGSGVALATNRGIFLSTSDGVRRLSPDTATLEQSVLAWSASSDEEEHGPYPLRTDMSHVAVHPSGEWIACGYQDSQHELRTVDGILVGEFGPLHSEYPHHAAFSPDGTRAIFNSCHFYNGVTSIGRVDELHTLRLGTYEEDMRLLPLESGARVYNSSFHEGMFLLGDAYGYIRAAKLNGDLGWQHFTGSSIGGVDVSPDGKQLAISTHAGFLSLLELSDEAQPYQIGNGPFVEQLRYVRWNDEALWRW